MSADRSEKIVLPDFLIAELYKNVLVEAGPFPVAPKSKKQNGAIAYLGKNKRQIAIVVNEHDYSYLSESNLAFLTNILSACSFSLADVAIINAAKTAVNFKLLKGELKASHLLLFDVEPTAAGLPFKVQPFQVQQFDGCSIIYAPSLPALDEPTENGKQLKKQLWVGLKRMFAIA